MPIKIAPCDCRHEYQDRVYGLWQRVHNVAEKTSPGKSGDKGNGRSLRCTVCCKTKPMAEGKSGE